MSIYVEKMSKIVYQKKEYVFNMRINRKSDLKMKEIGGFEIKEEIFQKNTKVICQGDLIVFQHREIESEICIGKIEGLSWCNKILYFIYGEYEYFFQEENTKNLYDYLVSYISKKNIYLTMENIVYKIYYMADMSEEKKTEHGKVIVYGQEFIYFFEIYNDQERIYMEEIVKNKMYYINGKTFNWYLPGEPDKIYILEFQSEEDMKRFRRMYANLIYSLSNNTSKKPENYIEIYL